MMKYLPILFLCLSVSAARAEPAPSLFFTNDEVRQVEAIEAALPPLPVENGDVYLGAVFLYGQDDWVLWLQNRRWTPETTSADLRILDVKPGEVHLSVTPPAGGLAQEITLKSHQTYRAATGDIVEGLPDSVPDNSR